jgi:hypothetical protein
MEVLQQLPWSQKMKIQRWRLSYDRLEIFALCNRSYASLQPIAVRSLPSDRSTREKVDYF